MPVLSPPEWLLLLAGAFAAAAVSGTAGFGGGVILVPLLAATFGVREAVPIVTLTQLVGNAARVLLNRRELDLRIAGRFALGGAPAAAAGALLFAAAPLAFLKRLLGSLLVGLVVLRRLRTGTPPRRPKAPEFAAVGAASGLLSALVGSVGPLFAPLFLNAGLTGGAYIGTETLCALTLHVVKLAAYGLASCAGADALPPRALAVGLLLAPAPLAGRLAGTRLSDRLSPRGFGLLIEATMLAAGVLFLIRG